MTRLERPEIEKAPMHDVHVNLRKSEATDSVSSKGGPSSTENPAEKPAPQKHVIVTNKFHFRLRVWEPFLKRRWNPGHHRDPYKKRCRTDNLGCARSMFRNQGDPKNLKKNIKRKVTKLLKVAWYRWQSNTDIKPAGKRKLDIVLKNPVLLVYMLIFLEVTSFEKVFRATWVRTVLGMPASQLYGSSYNLKETVKKEFCNYLSKRELPSFSRIDLLRLSTSSLVGIFKFFGAGRGASNAKRKAARVNVQVICKTDGNRRALWKNLRFRRRLTFDFRLSKTSLEGFQGESLTSVSEQGNSKGSAQQPKNFTWKTLLEQREILNKKYAVQETQGATEARALLEAEGLRVPSEKKNTRERSLASGVYFRRKRIRTHPQRGFTSKVRTRLYSVFNGRHILKASMTINGKGVISYFGGEPSKVNAALYSVSQVLWEAGVKKGPLAVVKAKSMRRFLTRCSFDVKSRGGGLQGQAEACSLGVAKSLLDYLRRWDAVLRMGVCQNLNAAAPERVFRERSAESWFYFVFRNLCSIHLSRYFHRQGVKGRLKSAGALSSDSRKKERKKFGLKKARKASQYSKR
jgi:ribosomal protein S9